MKSKFDMPHPAFFLEDSPQLRSTIADMEAGTYPKPDCIVWREGLPLDLARRLLTVTGGTPATGRCPSCGENSWGTADSDPQQCGACGTMICPICSADFAETYSDGAQDRLTDNLGDHIRQWHQGGTDA